MSHLKMKTSILIMCVIILGTFAFIDAQSQVIPSEHDYVPYTENYNVRFNSDGLIDYDLLIAKIMPEIFQKKLRTMGVYVSQEDIVLERGTHILMYQPQSYNCGYAIDHETNKVYWLEAAINSTHIEYANIYDKIPRSDVFELSFDCFYPLELQVAEKFLKEKSYFTPEEEARAAHIVKHELRGNDNLNKYKFVIGKFNFDYGNNALAFCGKLEGRNVGSDYFSGFQTESGELFFTLENSMPPLCAVKENAKLYDIKFQKTSIPDESFQKWKNIRMETVYLKQSSIERLLEQNYLFTDSINYMTLGYSSHMQLAHVDFEPENSTTVLKFFPSKSESHMKIRISDNNSNYYMPYGQAEWYKNKLVGVSILVDGTEIKYSKFPFVEAPDAPYPQYYTDYVFGVPANSTDVKITLDIENYHYDKKLDSEWRDY